MKVEYSKLPSEILSSRPELKETRTGITKGLIGGIPYIGTMINELIFDIPNRIQQDRINKSVELLNQKINSFGNEDFILKEYLESDDFFDFTRTFFETTLKLKSDEKRSLLAEVYLDAIIKSADFESSKNRLFIQFVSEITSVQIIILRYIQRFGNRLKEIESYDRFFNNFKNYENSFHLDNYEFKAYCNDLEIKGLISLGAGLEDYKDKSAYLVDGDHQKSSVTITNFGDEFLSYLIEYPHDSASF
ncbi:hypothetical protein [Marinifilum sp. D737]|uniref:hypothetical protein n=1 Tax=Marinifilum sp. D737 TaxID=2969628 RepID=UPI00227551D2|nr:hypothetical protein [Marinifilum sp. D737]MCY1636252.1 hypothetical protein [Marinifilum sp. D737]